MYGVTRASGSDPTVKKVGMYISQHPLYKCRSPKGKSIFGRAIAKVRNQAAPEQKKCLSPLPHVANVLASIDFASVCSLLGVFLSCPHCLFFAVGELKAEIEDRDAPPRGLVLRLILHGQVALLLHLSHRNLSLWQEQHRAVVYMPDERSNIYGLPSILL